MLPIHEMNINGLDLNLVRVLHALLMERSVTRAGERIGLSQPAVSAALGRLRVILNDQLFVRSGNDMVPTPKAEDLAGPVGQALAAIERAFLPPRAFDAATLERTFTLLGADFFSTLFMPRFSALALEQAPLARIRLLDSAFGEVAKLLQDNTIDIALERPLDMPEWVSKAVLFSSPFAVIARRGHPVLGDAEAGSVMVLEVFCSLHHAIRSIDGSMSGFADVALGAIGKTRRVSLALPHFHAVALAVSRSDLIACLPIQFANAVREAMQLDVFQAPVEILVPEIAMYWHARHDDDPVQRWLRGLVLSVVEDTGLNTDTPFAPS